MKITNNQLTLLTELQLQLRQEQGINIGFIIGRDEAITDCDDIQVIIDESLPGPIVACAGCKGATRTCDRCLRTLRNIMQLYNRGRVQIYPWKKSGIYRYKQQSSDYYYVEVVSPQGYNVHEFTSHYDDLPGALKNAISGH